MNSTLIKRVVEDKVQISENKIENRIQLTFDASSQGISASKTITLSGEGSIKVLLPV